MKKNKALRAASALLVLTLLTTSIIGGTFAKYTTLSLIHISPPVLLLSTALYPQRLPYFFQFQKHHTCPE